MLLHLLARAVREEDGNEVVEYALVLGLVVVGAIALMSALGIKVAEKWHAIVDAI